MIIIGFGGEKEVGKDTAASALITTFQFERRSFADPLKEMCAIAFEIPIQDFHNTVLKERPFNAPLTVSIDHLRKLVEQSEQRGINLEPEHVARLISILHKRVFSTPRQLLQVVGTEGFRQCVADDYWLRLFKNSLPTDDVKVAVTDMRFPNEKALIESLGGKTARVLRAGKVGGGHASESTLGDENSYSVVFQNNGSIEELQSKVASWYKEAFNGN